MSEIVYREGNDIDPELVVELYRDSTLGERRPVDDLSIISDMVRHANLVISAWDGEQLVGLARTLTDFAYVGYLSDLAVRLSYQRRGVGVRLIGETRARMGPRSSLVLLSAPRAVGYYPRIGFTKHESAWILKASDPFPL